jgi:hypothetical protein
MSRQFDDSGDLMHKDEQNNIQEHVEDGPMILAHDAVEGYRTVFYICITVGTLYLAFVLWQTW